MGLANSSPHPKWFRTPLGHWFIDHLKSWDACWPEIGSGCNYAPRSDFRLTSKLPSKWSIPEEPWAHDCTTLLSQRRHVSLPDVFAGEPMMCVCVSLHLEIAWTLWIWSSGLSFFFSMSVAFVHHLLCSTSMTKAWCTKGTNCADEGYADRNWLFSWLMSH